MKKKIKFAFPTIGQKIELKAKEGCTSGREGKYLIVGVGSSIALINLKTYEAMLTNECSDDLAKATSENTTFSNVVEALSYVAGYYDIYLIEGEEQ